MISPDFLEQYFTFHLAVRWVTWIIWKANSFLVYFPYFEKNKRRLKISPCCLCVCVSLLSLLVNGSANTSHGNEYTPNNRKTVGRNVFYAVCVVLNTQHVVKEKWATSSFQNFLFIILTSQVWITSLDEIVGFAVDGLVCPFETSLLSDSQGA
jgi:hypothetical protein